MNLLYEPKTDSLVITMGQATEAVPVEDILLAIPTQKTRLEYLRWMVHDIRKRRLEQIDEFFSMTKEIVTGIARNRKKMEELANQEEPDAKTIKALSQVVQAYARQKDSIKEIRHGTKLLALEEGKILANIAELETG